MRANVFERGPAWRSQGEVVHDFGNRWYIIGLLLVLAVSAFTHFYNLAGFPAPLYDEGVYIGRGLMFKDSHILYPIGRGFYGHPFMGWAFLSFIFTITGFPGAACSGNCMATPDALYNFYFAARAVAATFAILDTFLIYLIGTRAWRHPRYGLLGAALFAVAPASVWYFRMVLLDTLMAMWFLVALWLALEARDRRSPLLAAASGAAFGMAILTKVPAVFFLPTFIVIFLPDLLALLGIGRDPRARRGSLTLVLPWTALLLVTGMVWVGYALVNDQFLYLIGGLEWQAGMAGGYTFLGLMDYFRSIDPLLFFVGILGIAYAAFRRDLFALALGLGYVGFLAWLNVHWDFYIAPLIPPLAIVGGRFLGDAVGFLAGEAPRRVHRPRLVKTSRWAALALVVALLALLVAPLPGNTVMASQNYSWAPLQGVRYIDQHAPPYSLVLTNTVYGLALQQSRPDLWVINWWDSSFNSVLDNESHRPDFRPVVVQIRDPRTAQNVYQGTINGSAAKVTLPAGDYVATSSRLDVAQGQRLSAGTVPFHLDRNMAFIFQTYFLPPVVLEGRNPAANPNGPFTVTILDPLAMPRYILVDDQARSDATKIPFLQEMLGQIDPLPVYNNHTEDGVHDTSSGLLPLPAGIYRIKAYDGDRFLGSKLVGLGASPGQLTVVFNVDQVDTSPQAIEAVLSPTGTGLPLRVVVQHGDGTPVAWAYVEVERVGAVAIFDNTITSAEVRIQPGA